MKDINEVYIDMEEVSDDHCIAGIRDGAERLTKLSSTITQRKFGFNPNEERDESGRWKADWNTGPEWQARPDMKKATGDAMQLIKSKGYLGPKSIKFDTEKKMPDRAVAGADYDEIIINPKVPAEAKGRELNEWQRMKDIGFSATANPILHELGHVEHYHAIGSKIEFDNLLDRVVSSDIFTANQVSEYAGASPYEFVAEVFAGHLDGKEYGGDIMELYKKLGGPPLR